MEQLKNLQLGKVYRIKTRDKETITGTLVDFDEDLLFLVESSSLEDYYSEFKSADYIIEKDEIVSITAGSRRSKAKSKTKSKSKSKRKSKAKSKRKAKAKSKARRVSGPTRRRAPLDGPIRKAKSKAKSKRKSKRKSKSKRRS